MKSWFALLKRKAQQFLSLPLQIQVALSEAFVLLGISRGAVLLLPFRYISSFLGTMDGETPPTATDDQLQVAQQIAHAIALGSRYTPWRSNCLAQAITAKMMLRRRGVDSTLYLGVKKEDTGLEAHAWLRVGQISVTGGQISLQFHTICRFGGYTT